MNSPSQNGLEPMNAAATTPRPSYARRRAGVLVLVHVAFIAHIVHWKLAGKTLAPLELNELMYTLEAGVITAGFVFMLLVCLSVLIFGRFFCSWGCHILALQDLCSWFMAKVGVKPKVVRARGLLWIPMAVMLYMFVWPQLQFFFFERARPALHVASDASGWASFATADFWRNLPPPGVAVATLGLCGFGFVYLMGHRSFCKYACPYGAIFGLLDSFAPGRISSIGDCSACGLCTAACTSDVRVHEELDTYGQVVDKNCLKDLDCLNACPDAAIGFRFRKPAIYRDRSLAPPKPKSRMFSLGEECAMGLGFVPVWLVLRGLYGIVPLLLSIALSGMLVYLGVICARLLRADSVKLVRAQLKAQGRWRPAGIFVFALGTCASVFLAHSAAVRVQALRGERRVEAAAAGAELAVIESGISAWEFVVRHALFEMPGSASGLGALLAARGDRLAQEQHFEEAAMDYTKAVELLPSSAPMRFNLARLLSHIGHVQPALEHYRVAATLAPEDAETANNLGFLLMSLGQWGEAERELQRAIELRPDFAHPHFNLGRLLLESGDEARALELFARAAALDPLYAEWLAQEFPDRSQRPGTPEIDSGGRNITGSKHPK